MNSSMNSIIAALYAMNPFADVPTLGRRKTNNPVSGMNRYTPHQGVREKTRRLKQMGRL